MRCDLEGRGVRISPKRYGVCVCARARARVWSSHVCVFSTVSSQELLLFILAEVAQLVLR